MAITKKLVKTLFNWMILLIFPLLIICATPVDTVQADSDWTLTGNMNEARIDPMATTLLNGDVLVYGGRDLADTYLKTAEIYHPETGTWIVTGILNNRRVDGAGIRLLDGRVLVCGGEAGGGTSVNTAEIYDPASGTWATTSNMGVSRKWHTMTLLPNGKVLVVGGCNYPAFHRSAEIYDPVSGTWSPTGSMVWGRELHTATLLNDGTVLVAGGENYFPYEISAEAEIYNPTTGTWSVISSMHHARCVHTANVLPDGKVLVAAGLYSTGSGPAQALSSVEIYDPSTQSWTLTSSLNHARSIHSANSLPDGRVLVAGGMVPNQAVLDSAEIYDPTSGTWSLTGSLNTPRYDFPSASLADGSVLVAGGRPTLNSGIMNTAEIWGFPDATLSNLAISQGTLTPAFSPIVTSYTDSVPNSVTSITVTPTVNESHATVAVDGTPVISGNPSGSITLNVGSNTVTIVVTAQDGTTTKTYIITVTRLAPPTGSISGHIDNGNNPIPGVVLVWQLGPSGSWLYKGATGAGANGNYIFAGLPTGQYSILGEATGRASEWYNNTYDQIHYTGVQVTAPNNTPNINFSLAPGGAISGHVQAVNGGTPISGASILIYEYGRQTGYTNFCATGLSDGNGNYTTFGMPEGDYAIKVTAAGHATKWYSDTYNPLEATPIHVSVGATVPGINFSLSPGASISGRVQDANTGAGIEGVAIYVIDCSLINLLPDKFPAYDNVWTNQNGNYIVSGLATGEYRVSAVSAASLGYAGQRYSQCVSVAPPGNVSNIDFSLVCGGSLSGFVYEPDSITPIERAQVNIYEYDTNSAMWIYRTHTYTYINGHYQTPGLSPQEYKVQAVADGYVRQWYQNVRNEADATPLEIVCSVDIPGINFVLVPPSTDATLSNLTMSQGTLTPAFDPIITSYSDSVLYGVTSMAITPTVNESHASLTVNGTPVVSGSPSVPISLSVGDNTITTVVTAEDGITTNAYTVTVTRAAPVPPTVTTGDAAGIGTNSAVLNMSYTLGDYSPVDVGFAYKKSSDSTWTNTSWEPKSESGSYTEPLVGLDSNTQYDFKAQLKYDTTEIDGVAANFTTLINPDITVVPTTIDFGPGLVGTGSILQTVTVINDGVDNLTVGIITLGGVNADQFLIQNDNCSGQTIIPDNSGTIQVVFSPTSEGVKTAVLSIPSDDPDEAIINVSLYGIGQTPAQATEDLISDIEELNLPQGTENSLNSKLDAAIESLDAGNENAAINQLNAFINYVSAQAGKKLTEEQANELMQAAQMIIDGI